MNKSIFERLSLLLITFLLFCACMQSNNPIYYKIIYDKNDFGAVGTMDKQTLDPSTSKNLTACAFTKTGWKFAGWATTTDGNVAYADQAKYTIGTSDVTLYAKWTPPAVYLLKDRGPAGGWILYDKGSYSNGWRYLEAASTDQISRVWGTYNYDTSADRTAIGDGKQNTLDIIAGDTLANKAADECANCIIINGGVTYDDWFLPSLSELEAMYFNLNKQGVGGFSNNYYQSSSEFDIASAWQINFTDGSQVHLNKYNVLNVRAVRTF